MRDTRARVLFLTLVLGCGGGSGDVDGGAEDASTELDGSVTPSDGGLADGAVADGAVADAGPEDASVDGGASDGGAPRTSEQITLVRGTPAGTIEPVLPVEEAVVTYVRAALDADPAGFFVQADTTGPALFVAVDPDSLVPPPAAGDVVRFDVSGTARVSDQLRVLTIRDYAREAQGANVAALVQDLSAADDAAQAERYESELVTIRGTVRGAPSEAGPGHLRVQLETAAVNDPLLVFRASTDTFASAPIASGCEVEVGPTPTWRFADSNQVAAYLPTEVRVRSCPAPILVSAVAMDPTHVVLTFDRDLDPATVDAGDFSFVGASALDALAVNVDGRVVTVTTGSMVDGTSYTVIVSGLSDVLGTPIGSRNSASFTGRGAGLPSLIISEYLESVAEARTLEITNVGDVATTAAGCQIVLYANGNVTPNAPRPLPAIPAGSSLVVCHTLAPPGIAAACDLVDTSAVSFNGNDTIEIVCGGSTHDIFGQIGVDPGVGGWGDGSGPSSVDTTLRRACVVGVGDRDTDDTFVLGAEWVEYPAETYTDLGSHCP